MKAPFFALVLVGVLAVSIWGFVSLDRDARILGLESSTLSALDTPTGRTISVAVLHDDIAARNTILLHLAEVLAASPLIDTITTGPAAPEQVTIEWLWTHRFRLAPPPSTAFAVDALATEMSHAAQSLVSGRGLVFGDKALRDPTGSFRRLIARLEQRSRLPVTGGIFQSIDGQAALMFAKTADAPFEPRLQHALTTRLQEAFAAVSAPGVELIVTGPRVVAARVSHRIAEASTTVAAVSSALMILWLVWLGRSASNILRFVLPLLIGVAAAVLSVQILFGSVHMIALGFGGALIGLAIDYPMHLLSHGAKEQVHTRRLVLLGAATTALAFGALLASGLPGLSQVGVFVATGLLAAGLASVWLCRGPREISVRQLAAERLLGRWRFKTSILIATCALSFGAMSQVDVLRVDPHQIVTLPSGTLSDIRSMQAMAQTVDERFYIDIRADTENAVLEAAEQVLPILDEAQALGHVASRIAISDFVPSQPRQTEALPATSEFAALASQASIAAGLSSGFQSVLMAEYQAALDAPPVTASAMMDALGLPDLNDLLFLANGQYASVIMLEGLGNAHAVARRIAALDDPAVRFVDAKGEIADALDRHRRAAATLLIFGAISAIGLLVIFAPHRGPVADLVLTLVTCVAATSAIMAVVSGGLGIFQIIALTLVTGIGIDYGLFLSMADTTERRIAAARSVLVCAITTLIAFTILALSPIQILKEIGLTVSLGIALLLTFHFAFQPAGERPSDRT